MERLSDVADAAAAAMREWLGDDVRDVRVHGGPFTRAEIARLSTTLPAIYVTVPSLRVPAPRAVQVECLASVVAYAGRVVAPGRDVEALTLRVVARIPEERWRPHFEGPIGPATDVRARNEFDAGLAEKGLGLWTVRWRHVLQA